MRAHRLSIILLLGTLWTLPAARAADTEPDTVARQDYSYDPRAEAVTLELTTVYSGRDADAFRLFYANAGVDGYRKAKLDYYRTMYDAVAEAAPPKVRDDGHDAVETTERYTVSLAGLEDDEQLHKFPIYPDLLRGFFSKLPPTIRQPYKLDALDRRDIVTVTAPTLGVYEVHGAEVAGRYFTFTRNARTRPGHVEMDYRLRFLTGGVPVAEFEQYRADIERMDHNIYAWIDLDRGLYRRYYRDIPTMIRIGVIVLLAAGLAVLGWRVLRPKRAA